MSKVYYTEDHEWIRLEGDEAVVGITDYAQEQLGDIVFVELPETGSKVAKEDPFIVVESVKAASDVYAPVSGEVLAVNEALAGEPELINSGAEGDGWLVRMKIDDVAQLENLMDADAYKASVA